jgi:hypothetical protein
LDWELSVSEVQCIFLHKGGITYVSGGGWVSSQIIWVLRRTYRNKLTASKQQSSVNDAVGGAGAEAMHDAVAMN